MILNLHEKLVEVLDGLRKDPNPEYRGFVHGCKALLTDEGKLYIFQFERDRIVFEINEEKIINHVNPKSHRHPRGYAHILGEYLDLLVERLEEKIGYRLKIEHRYAQE